MFSFYKLVVGHTRPFHFIRHGEHMAMSGFDAFVILMREGWLTGDAESTAWQFTPQADERLDRAHRGIQLPSGWAGKYDPPFSPG
jgi:hypothetical protein